MSFDVFKQEIEKIAQETKGDVQKLTEKLNEAVSKGAKAEDVEGLKSEIGELNTKLGDYGMKLQEATEQARFAKGVDPKEVALKALDETLKSQADAIKQAANGGAPVKLDIVKAAETIGTANFGAGVLQGLRMAGIDNLDRNPQMIMNQITVINGGPGSDPFSVIEKVIKEGGAAPVAENQLIPLYDFTYAEKKRNAETIAALVPVNEQALNRMPLLRSHILTELMAELEQVTQAQIILGNGASPQLDGIKNNATPFDAGFLANKVVNPDAYAVVRAVAAQVYRAHGKAATINVHPDTAALFDLEKAVDGHYIMPPFVSADGTVIKGVRVVECFELGTDEFLAGDLKHYMLNIAQDISIAIGTMNDQFGRLQLSVRAHYMAAGLVKNQHKNKIIKGDFTTAIAALKKPA